MLRTGYLVHDISRLRRRFFDLKAEPLGLTRAQWWALYALSRQPTAITQNDLAEVLEVGSASVGELLKRLERSGFVRRSASADDRRVKYVSIADRGREVLEKMRVVADMNNVHIFGGIPASDQATLNALLAQMRSNLLDLLAAEGMERFQQRQPRIPDVANAASIRPERRLQKKSRREAR